MSKAAGDIVDLGFVIPPHIDKEYRRANQFQQKLTLDVRMWN
jgi:hypothetical protein